MERFFNAYDFLECFDREVERYLDEDGHIPIYNYPLNTDDNHIFTVSLNPIERTIYLELKQHDSKNPIFQFNFNDHTVDRVSLTKESNVTFLNIFKNQRSLSSSQDKASQIPFFSIMIKPSISMILTFDSQPKLNHYDNIPGNI